MAKTIYFFIKNNQRIPFSQFLQDVKKSRGCSWKELGKICGVNRISAYVLAQTKGEPESPPRDKFLQIISALGYSENDFGFNHKKRLIRTHGWHRLLETDYKEQLRMLGERVLQINQDNLERGANLQKLSVPIIKELCGAHFYKTYARGWLNKQKLYQDLLTLDPRFSNIEIQHQPQRRTVIRNLEDFERDIIENSLLSTDQTRPHSSERLPRSTHKYVLDELNKEYKKRGLPTRTYASCQLPPSLSHPSPHTLTHPVE